MTAYLFAEKGSIVSDFDAALEKTRRTFATRVLEVHPGFPFPMWIAGLLFAVEGSLVDPPEDLPIVYIHKNAPFPYAV